MVLVFIDWYLPGYKAGGPVRSMANMVERLRDRIDFHIVTSDTEYTETTPYPGIIPDTWTTRPGGEKVWYASSNGTGRAAWRGILAEKEWGAVYINGIYSRPFSILPLWLLRNNNLKKVVAVRGMLGSGVMSHSTTKKRLFLTAGRMLGLYRNVIFQATNQEEKDDIERWLQPKLLVQVVPNLARKLDDEQVATRLKENGTVKLVSVARIAMEKNTLLALKALALVKARVSYHLIGPVYDEAYWDQCQSAIAALPENITVEHRGTLPPDQVCIELQKYHGLLMPSEGENFGHTMLEALCAGTPLIISDRTPWRDLEKEHAGWDVPINGDAPEQLLAQHINDLAAMDQRTFNGWSNGAYEVGKRYLNDPMPLEKTWKLLNR